MPKPKKGERKKHFIKRCIPYMIENEPDTLTSKDKKSKQSYAICNSIFDRRNKKKKNESIVKFSEYNEDIHFEEDFVDDFGGKYWVYLQQNGVGCDYTIGCSQTLVQMEADNMDDLLEKVNEEYGRVDGGLSKIWVFECDPNRLLDI